MMEKAIEVMKQSINEPRADGKPSPAGGCGACETGRDGGYRVPWRASPWATTPNSHCWNESIAMNGSMVRFLFATLEPCAPGARKHPKLACAERIVNARITEVWVGIEDPDPTVDRQGIRYLEENGVKVHLFDRDLQDQIRAANKKFIEEALKRAAEAKMLKAAKPSPLSRWDEALAVWRWPIWPRTPL